MSHTGTETETETETDRDTDTDAQAHKYTGGIGKKEGKECNTRRRYVQRKRRRRGKAHT